MNNIKYFTLQFISIFILILNSYFLGPYIRKPFSPTVLIMSALYIVILAIFTFYFFGLFQRAKEIPLVQRILIVVCCIILSGLLGTLAGLQ